MVVAVAAADGVASVAEVWPATCCCHQVNCSRPFAWAPTEEAPSSTTSKTPCRVALRSGRGEENRLDEQLWKYLKATARNNNISNHNSTTTRNFSLQLTVLKCKLVATETAESL